MPVSHIMFIFYAVKNSGIDEAAMNKVLARIQASKKTVKNANKAARKRKQARVEESGAGRASPTASQTPAFVVQAVPLSTTNTEVQPPPSGDLYGLPDKHPRIDTSPVSGR